MSKTFGLPAALFSLALGTAGMAAAQSMSPMPPAGQGSGGAQAMQGMCGGMCGGMAMPAQGQAAPSQGMMQDGCPMMRRMAMLDERLRRLEEHGGAAPSPQQDMPPSTPR